MNILETYLRQRTNPPYTAGRHRFLGNDHAMTDLINELRAQLAEVTTERDEMLRRIGANETAQLLTEAVKKQCEETQRIASERDASDAVVKAAREYYTAVETVLQDTQGASEDDHYNAICARDALRDALLALPSKLSA